MERGSAPACVPAHWATTGQIQNFLFRDSIFRYIRRVFSLRFPAVKVCSRHTLYLFEDLDNFVILLLGDTIEPVIHRDISLYRS